MEGLKVIGTAGDEEKCLFLKVNFIINLEYWL